VKVTHHPLSFVQKTFAMHDKKWHPLDMRQRQLIIATRNAHKTMEIRQIVGESFDVRDANDYPDFPTVEETGVTFLENATLKAEAISACVDGYVLSDDSGLEVDALDSAPGVWSSSYGGEEGNHARNNLRLIEEMKLVPDDQRTGRFVCVMVIARDGKAVAHFRGTVEGRILSSPSGNGGFGYDPLFAPLGYHQSFAELGAEIKNQLSHRSRALAKAIEWLSNSSAEP
jgi:XTP/dITP diphosphohydrolase